MPLTLLRLDTSRVVLKRPDGRLDTLVVEVGVILGLELCQKLLQLTDSVLERVALVDDVVERIPELVDACLGQSDENTQLSTATFAADDLALFLLLDFAVLLSQLFSLGFEVGNLLLEVDDLSFDLLTERLGFLDENVSLLGCLFHVLSLLFF